MAGESGMMRSLGALSERIMLVCLPSTNHV